MTIKSLGGALVFLLLTSAAPAQPIKNAIPDLARPLSLSSVRVTGPTGRFYDLNYKIPAELIKDKRKVTVRFQSTGGNETATVFGIRLVRE